MVFFNYALRKLNAKIVYYGPGLCGKTTNLKWIHDHFEGGGRGKIVSLATEGDRTIFFDLLPLDIGTVRGMDVTLQLYTVPGQVHYNATRQLVLKGADGVVFVGDSQRAMQGSNLESWNNLKENLLMQGVTLKDFPHILQFNKRDLRDIQTLEEMDEALNEYDAPIYESVATTGIGVQETLEGIVKLVMRSLRDRYQPAATPVGTGLAAEAPKGPKVAIPPQPPAPDLGGTPPFDRVGPFPSTAPSAENRPSVRADAGSEWNVTPEGDEDPEAVTHPIFEADPALEAEAPPEAFSASTNEDFPLPAGPAEDPFAANGLEVELGSAASSPPEGSFSRETETVVPDASVGSFEEPAAAGPFDVEPPDVEVPPEPVSEPGLSPAAGATTAGVGNRSVDELVASVVGATRMEPLYPSASDPVAPPEMENVVAKKIIDKAVRPELEPFVFGAGDPFDVKEFGPAPTIPAEASAVVRLPGGLQGSGAGADLGIQASPNQLTVRLEGTEALARSGDVRELDIMVPVPGGWIGNRRVTLQLRLTLVPAVEEDE